MADHAGASAYTLAILLSNMVCFASSTMAPVQVTFNLANLENGGNGRLVVLVHPDWAPNAAERFASLAQQDFFSTARFFKVIPGFAAHFGLSGNPSANAEWKHKQFEQDPKSKQNIRGRISFVVGDDGITPHATEVVINTKDNELFDRNGYVPFGEITEGMFFIDRLYSKYGSKVSTAKIEAEGNAYLTKEFPKLSFIESVETFEQRPDLVQAKAEVPPAIPKIGLIGVLGVCFAIFLFVARTVARKDTSVKVVQ